MPRVKAYEINCIRGPFSLLRRSLRGREDAGNSPLLQLPACFAAVRWIASPVADDLHTLLRALPPIGVAHCLGRYQLRLGDCHETVAVRRGRAFAHLGMAGCAESPSADRRAACRRAG